jgi:hypothetical protein
MRRLGFCRKVLGYNTGTATIDVTLAVTWIALALTGGPGTLRRLQDGIGTFLHRTVFRRACGAANVGHRLRLFSDAAAGTDVVQYLQWGCGRARDRSHI